MTTSTSPETTPAQASTRKIVFVAGSGRSGTSTFSGILQQLGMYVPKPEVAADHTNPRGFSESQWVVDFHSGLLKRACVQMSDARPTAWDSTGKLGASEATREKLTPWLSQQFDHAEELVIKDPRLSWFLDLWRTAARRTQADACFTTMLRPPTEVVGSKYNYYRQNSHESSKKFADGIAAWVNLMLHTEHATRGANRVFIRYHDLLDDWKGPLFQAGDHLSLKAIQNAGSDDIAKINEFIDPSLRRIQLTWDDVPVPDQLRELATQTWNQLSVLATPDGDSPAVHQQLDTLLEEYVRFYGDAEAVARSSIVAAKQEVRRKMAKASKARAKQPPARGLTHRVPLRVRAAFPSSVRRLIRRVVS